MHHGSGAAPDVDECETPGGQPVTLCRRESALPQAGVDARVHDARKPLRGGVLGVVAVHARDRSRIANIIPGRIAQAPGQRLLPATHVVEDENLMRPQLLSYQGPHLLVVRAQHLYVVGEICARAGPCPQCKSSAAQRRRGIQITGVVYQRLHLDLRVVDIVLEMVRGHNVSSNAHALARLLIIQGCFQRLAGHEARRRWARARRSMREQLNVVTKAGAAAWAQHDMQQAARVS
mmetsp:Transcript_39484/g.108777  ORF Transcript_39484/g.108777 Transcript_39484/m.108777 type:complete len:234 (+) Transcript_39484:459-1160(+)